MFFAFALLPILFLWLWPWQDKHIIRSSQSKTPRPVTFPQDVTATLRRGVELLLNETYPPLVSEYGIPDMPLEVPKCRFDWDNYPLFDSIRQEIVVDRRDDDTIQQTLARFRVTSACIDSLQLWVKESDEQETAVEWIDTENPMEKQVELKLNRAITGLSLVATRDCPFETIFMWSTSMNGVAFGGPQLSGRMYHLDFVADKFQTLILEEITRNTFNTKLGTFWVVPAQTATEYTTDDLQKRLAEVKTWRPSLDRDLQELYARPRRKSRTDLVMQTMENITRNRQGNHDENSERRDSDLEAGFVVIDPRLDITVQLEKPGSVTVLVEADTLGGFEGDFQGNGHASIVDSAARFSMVGKKNSAMYCPILVRPEPESKNLVEFTIEGTVPAKIYTLFDKTDTLVHLSGGTVYRTRAYPGWIFKSTGTSTMHVIVEFLAPPEERKRIKLSKPVKLSNEN